MNLRAQTNAKSNWQIRNLFTAWFLMVVIALPTPAQTLRKAFFQLYGGYSFHRPARMQLALNNYDYEIQDVQFSSRSFQQPWFYGFAAGIRIREGSFPIYLKAEFIHDKIYVRKHHLVEIVRSTNPEFVPGQKYPFREILQNFSMSHGYNFLLFQLSMRVVESRVSNRPFWVQTGVGGGFLVPHVESENSEGKTEKYQWLGPAGTVSLDVNWSIYRNWAWMAALRFNLAKIDRASVVGGNLSSTLRSWVLFSGLELSR